jgi:hypothetical protein
VNGDVASAIGILDSSNLPLKSSSQARKWRLVMRMASEAVGHDVCVRENRRTDPQVRGMEHSRISTGYVRRRAPRLLDNSNREESRRHRKWTEPMPPLPRRRTSSYGSQNLSGAESRNCSMVSPTTPVRRFALLLSKRSSDSTSWRRYRPTSVPRSSEIVPPDRGRQLQERTFEDRSSLRRSF